MQIGTHVNDWNLDDAGAVPGLRGRGELGAAVFVHPWDMIGEERMQKYWLPWLVGHAGRSRRSRSARCIFGGVLERLPKLRIAFAHGGGAFPATIGRIEHGFEARPDLVRRGQHRATRANTWGASGSTRWCTIRTCCASSCELFGPDRVALGSDYPFPLGEDRAGRADRVRAGASSRHP